MTGPGPWTVLAALGGAVIGLGLTFLLIGVRGRPQDAPEPMAGARAAAARAVRLLAGPGPDRVGSRIGRRFTIPVLVGVAAGLVTGWPIGAVLAGLGAWALPRWWRPDADGQSRVERIEAIAVWTEMLRDTLSAAAGLEQAVLATAATAPPAIIEPVGSCAARIRSGATLPQALSGLADDLADPTGDLVVAALTMAATRQARHLSDLLSSLARAARDQVVMRLRVAAGRARIRASVRIILGVTAGMVTGLVLLNRGYLTAYDTVGGQLVLLIIGVIFAACFMWLDKIGTIPVEGRLLTTRPTPPSPPAILPGRGSGGGRGVDGRNR